MIRDLVKEEEHREKFYQEHGYPPNFEEDIIYMLRHVNISEEGKKELWNWFSKEIDKPLEEE